ncbi:unnamed protein product [Blepharisma stoltei]|uniref:Uncharacterized protein n=1 Tax=Blepharisma stoltei TaxID=1481888 RepID=A0AAU9JTQ6_9CILI|nr:unnamed protein product [Blepharisma stoltei]
MQSKLAGLWLLSAGAGVFGMITGGSYLRVKKSPISSSGESLSGFKLQTTEQEWEEKHRTHQLLCESKGIQPIVNLEEYKLDYNIYISHIALAQGLGVYIAVPSLIGLLTRKFGGVFAMKLIGINSLFALGGYISQVLKQDKTKELGIPDSLVFPAYMGTGVSLYSLLMWTGFFCFRKPQAAFAEELVASAYKGARRRFMGLTHLSLFTFFAGLLVSSTKAGNVLNNWPWYGKDYFFPESAWDLEPAYKNFYENRAMIQFVHRTLGTLAYLGVLDLFTYQYGKPLPFSVKFSSFSLLLLMTAQLIGGIKSLKDGPQPEGTLGHSTNSILMLTILYYGLHVLRRR